MTPATWTVLVVVVVLLLVAAWRSSLWISRTIGMMLFFGILFYEQFVFDAALRFVIAGRPQDSTGELAESYRRGVVALFDALGRVRIATVILGMGLLILVWMKRAEAQSRD